MSDFDAEGAKVVFEDFVRVIDECGHANQFTRSIDLQRARLSEIPPLLERVKSFKTWAAARSIEDLANELFHVKCMLRAMESSLSVWISIKEGRHQAAWSHLVDAQEYKDVALLVKDYEGARTFEAHLAAMEMALFPHALIFNSAALTQTIGDCSICGQPFLACLHIEGLVYMGRLCRRINFEITGIDHFALVARPLDRRCVMTRCSNEAGRMIDRFTLEDLGPKPDAADESTQAEVIVMTARDLDFD